MNIIIKTEVVVEMVQGHLTTQPETVIQPMGGSIKKRDLQTMQAIKPQGKQRIQLSTHHHQLSLNNAITIPKFLSLYLQ